MIKIVSATYGEVDCTHVIKSSLVNNTLVIQANNSIIGDPRVGEIKYLNVSWIQDDVEHSISVREGLFLRLPKSTNDRLAIFYSNNNNPSIWPAIQKSLDTIRIATDGIADVITCTWEPIPNNPFYNIPSWYTSQSHLNQLLQVLQCLYTARETGKYKYVSFCEHDVMYPAGYFDYPEFKSGDVLTNMNYGGLCADGWQARMYDHEPFHQMTMVFDDAISHCESILPNAIRTNNGMIETQTLNRIQWTCKNEAIHINHGVHFTSHNSIYSRTELSGMHAYWGDFNDYISILNVAK